LLFDRHNIDETAQMVNWNNYWGDQQESFADIKFPIAVMSLSNLLFNVSEVML